MTNVWTNCFMTWWLTCFRIWWRRRSWKKQLRQQTRPGHVRLLTAWWRHFRLTSWDRRRRAAEDEGECRARWLLSFRHSVSADETHTSPWWQQRTASPSSWPRVLQQLEQIQTVACLRWWCDAEYGVCWRLWRHLNSYSVFSFDKKSADYIDASS